MRITRVEMSNETRQRMTALLNQHVTDLTDLFIQTKLAHWNVRGPHFIAYHKLFDALASNLTELIDTVAERATALGAIAGVPVQAMADETSLPVWRTETTEGLAVIKQLADSWAVVANSARKAIETSADADPDTSDLFTEVSRQMDKDLWFLEAHLAE